MIRKVFVPEKATKSPTSGATGQRTTTPSDASPGSTNVALVYVGPKASPPRVPSALVDPAPVRATVVVAVPLLRLRVVPTGRKE